MKISIANKGRSRNLGSKLTEEHKRNISAGNKRILSQDKIDGIIESYNKGLSCREIATIFNSNHTTISKHINNYLTKQLKPK